MKYLSTYKLFAEATYYEDDLNVDITSTVSDIFEDLTDDSDFDVVGKWGNTLSNFSRRVLNADNEVLGLEMRIYLDGENIDQNETNVNESLLEIKEDAEYIQDIFSGVIDDGVRVFFARAGLPNRYTIRIGEYSDQVKFKYINISNEIEHLKSYLINECNMRLSDVEVDFVECNSSDVYGYGRRLEGWEKLNILKEKDTEMYSMAISFVRRGLHIKVLDK